MTLCDIAIVIGGDGTTMKIAKNALLFLVNLHLELMAQTWFS